MDVKTGTIVVDRDREPVGRVSGVVVGPDGTTATHVWVVDDQHPGVRIAIVVRDVLDRNDDELRLALTRADIDRLEQVREAPAGSSALVPLDPADLGLEPVEVDISDVEPMHEVANEARDDLRKQGFSDDEIDDWARQFVAARGPGDEIDFITWVRTQEHRST